MRENKPRGAERSRLLTNGSADGGRRLAALPTAPWCLTRNVSHPSVTLVSASRMRTNGGLVTSVAERPTGNRRLQVPPHSIEAEESVLGAVLLSSDAANIALESLKADDFYRPAHQQVFEAVQTLFDANEPIDAVTVSEMLRQLFDLVA